MESLNKKPLVCVFDSGIGGLNLLYECVRKNPFVDFCYFADNFRVPYGSLNAQTLFSYVFEIFEKIKALCPSAAVVACNTVTAECIEVLRKNYSFPIIGIQPAIKPALSVSQRCTVFATPRTANSNSLKSLIEKYGKDRVDVVACPNLAAYIEENIFSLDPEKVISLLPNISPECVVVGCTHYIFVEEIIRQRYKCQIFDGIEGTADHLSKILGIFDHFVPRAQKIAFLAGDTQKNRDIWRSILKKKSFIP